MARKSDKEDILMFCASTFSWGDYIELVWDIWYGPNARRKIIQRYQYHMSPCVHVENGSGLKAFEYIPITDAVEWQHF